MGDFAAARRRLDLAIPMYDAEAHRSLAFRYSQDPGASSLSYLSWTEWYLGFPGRALQRGQEALALAEASGHPLTLAFVLMCLAMSHVLRREWSAARSRAETAIQISRERGFPQTLWYSSSIYARTFVEEGHLKPHLSDLQEAVTARKAIGLTLAGLFELSLLAEAYGLANRAADGMSVLSGAIQFADRTGEGFHLPELHRLKGELLLRQSSAYSTEADRNLQLSNEAKPGVSLFPGELTGHSRASDTSRCRDPRVWYREWPRAGPDPARRAGPHPGRPSPPPSRCSRSGGSYRPFA